MDFNPRARKERDGFYLAIGRQGSDFNPRARKERDGYIIYMSFKISTISIHAPVKSATVRKCE